MRDLMVLSQECFNQIRREFVCFEICGVMYVQAISDAIWSVPSSSAPDKGKSRRNLNGCFFQM